MNTSEAVDLCKHIESFAPGYGCHVALTGGCLYKDGDRKDVDILFYRIRQVEKIDIEGLKEHLNFFGFSEITGFGWVLKSTFNGNPVDMFFPEEIEGEYPQQEEKKEII